MKLGEKHVIFMSYTRLDLDMTFSPLVGIIMFDILCT